MYVNYTSLEQFLKGPQSNLQHKYTSHYIAVTAQSYFYTL